ncbi:membrane protein insertion efficiency factor YidD [Galbibacter sp. EGI 63066]|uniref:membrane protein insertion efficiency factor YidD n=1 Tax=Galbibacter sp. EGI 63066 TaxID=2993559 RepID=UPI0022498900|nr:membrane protein insertion efficiency factor YidD [Galbibacter sp. EGI 63066]MCX2681764.1 membrane protein insertion efficiency factor YidD [Galbibacter sp. EGI 63066]
MKTLLLNIIKIYWKLIPESKRKKCIFKKSCSHFVFDAINEEGFIIGLKALVYRFKRCRPGYMLFKNPITGKRQIILKTQEILEEEEIAESIINKT